MSGFPNPGEFAGDFVALVPAATGIVAVDTATINTARDAAGVGGKLVFPGGTYATSGIVADKANQTWSCQGTTFTSNAANTPVLRLSAAGITIDGGTFSGVSGTGTGITNGAGDNCTIRNATAISTSSWGIYVHDVNGFTADGCAVTNSGDIGIFVEVISGSDVTDPTIVRCKVDRSSLGTGLTEGGIKVHGTGTLKVRRAKIHDNRVLMPTSPVSINCICIEVFNGCPYASILGNETSGGSMGISVDRSDNGSVVGNVVFNASIYGIEIPASNEVTVSGNVIDGNGLSTRGIILDGSSPFSRYCTVVGNAVRGYTPHGIHQNGGNDVVISGNSVQNDTAGAVNGIYVQGVTSSVVTGNLVDCGSVGTRCVQVDTSTNIAISGNQFRDSTSNPVNLLVASAFVIDHVSVVGNSTNVSGAMVSTTTSGGGSIGVNFNQWLNGDGQNRLNNSNARIALSTGSPEAATSGDPGSLFLRQNGGPGTSLYTKVNGTGNTGWMAMPASLYKSGAGVTNLADGDFPATPPDGSMGVAHNTTTGLSAWCARANGTWKAVAIA